MTWHACYLYVGKIGRGIATNFIRIEGKASNRSTASQFIFTQKLPPWCQGSFAIPSYSASWPSGEFDGS
jgi:hypothetical protein